MPENDEPGNRDGMCVAANGCKRHAVIGYLCRGHFERLGAMLRDIEDEAAILSAVPSMQQRVGSGKGSLASERAPARLDVLVHTDRRRGTGRSETDDDANAAGDTLPILDVLHSWARVVREERGFVPGSVTVTGERDLLTRQLEWIAEQPWVDECYGDLSRLLGQLRACNGTAPEKPAGRCYLPDVDGECGGPIWVDQVAGHAYCGRCRATWDGPQLALLNHEMQQQRREAARPRTDDGRPMETAEEIAARIGKTVNAVRILASRSGMVSTDGHYDPALFVKESA